MTNKILFVQCYEAGSVKSDFLFRRPAEYREQLIKAYPKMKEWAREEIFNQVEPWPREVDIQIVYDEINVPGRYIAGNIETPSHVIDKPITPELLLAELEKDSYTHVGFTIISNAYTNFINCARVVKNFNPSIETIAGSTGAMFPETGTFVDHVCVGKRGVPFIRELFHEDVNKPYNLVIMPDHARYKYLKQEVTIEQCRIVTRVGCPLNCDFCATYKLFNGEYTGELFTPKQVHDALVEYRDDQGLEKLSVGITEPTAIIPKNKEWWYEFFDLFKEDHGDFSLFIASPTFSMDALDYRRITNSAARISIVNIGIESFSKQYAKNKNIDFKALTRKMSDHGISTYATYIIGFDFDSKTSVWNDIKKLMELEIDGCSILNLHPHPMTAIWDKLASHHRLLDVPPEFYHTQAFQPYTHPHFKPGFDDMFPLLCELYKYVETENGCIPLNVATTLENLLSHTNHPRLIKKEIRSLKSISKMMYPHWKAYFKPTAVQNANYLKKLKPIKERLIPAEIVE